MLPQFIFIDNSQLSKEGIYVKDNKLSYGFQRYWGHEKV